MGILFVGQRNLRRDRIAEILFNAAASKLNLPVRAKSCGTEPGSGAMPKDALDFLSKANIRDILATARQPVKLESVEPGTRIISFEALEVAGFEIEIWNAKDLAAIDSMVNSLIARLLGGGGPEPRPVAERPDYSRPAKPKKLGPVKVGRETAGRRGKGVTTIFDLTLADSDLSLLATKLKQLCGTGGTAKDGRIEIQGDHRDRIIEEFTRLGFQPKRAGG